MRSARGGRGPADAFGGWQRRGEQGGDDRPDGAPHTGRREPERLARSGRDRGSSPVAAGPRGVDPRFERSVRRWLWAYPRRWRWARSDEVVGTLADLAGPGATRLDLRSGFGLVIHGLRTRRRMRPPLRHVARYALVNAPLPWQYRGWMADRIAGPLFNRGPLLGLAFYFFGFAVLRSYEGDAALADVVWAGALGLTCWVGPRDSVRRAEAARHLVGRPGEPPTPWDQRAAWVLRDRVTGRSLLPTFTLVVGTVAVGGVATAVILGPGPVAPLAGAAAVGAAGALRLVARWRRRVPVRPPQPARRLRVAGRSWWVSAWCWGAVAMTSPSSWPLSGLVPPPGRASMLLVPTALVLPSLVVGWILARRGPDDLAFVDVWRLLAGTGPLPVDALQRGVLPASWFSPEAAAGGSLAAPSSAPPTPGVA